MPEPALDDVDDAEDDAGSRPNAELRVLRKQKEQWLADQARVAELERREAFRTAGLDPSDPKTSYFVKGYAGDLSADAIRAEAETAGFLSPPPKPGPDPTVTALGRVTNAGAGPQTGADFPAAEWLEASSKWRNHDDVVRDMRRFGIHVTGEDV